MTTARVFRILAGVALAVAGIALTASQSACGGDNNYSSPTAPPAPQSPAPTTGAFTSARYILLIEPTNEEASYPLAGEVLVDGRTIWAGPMGVPGEDDLYWTYTGWYQYESVPFNINTEVRETLSTGWHSLSFRVTDQRRSPTRYTISGFIDATWSSGRVRRVGSWEGVEVRLGTGQAWSGGFFVPDRP